MTKYDPPNAPLCYLAEPIDRAQGIAPQGSRIGRELATQGLAVFRPAAAWHGGNHHPAVVERINRQALDVADVLIADYTSGIPTIGVSMEVEAHTARSRIAVVLWQHGVARSVSLQANPNVVWAETANEAVELAADYGFIRWKQRVDALGQLPPIGMPELRLQTALGAPEPKRAYRDDAGIDLITAVDTEIPPGRFVDVPTTVIGVQPPADSWLMITGRSSTLRKHGLHVPLAVIDPGWRGPLFVGVWNLGIEPVHVKAGDRLGQIVAMPNRTAELLVTTGNGVELDPHERGLRGFGSTGRGDTPVPVDQRIELPAGTDMAAVLPAAGRPPHVAAPSESDRPAEVAWPPLRMMFEAPLAQLPPDLLAAVVDTERTVG